MKERKETAARKKLQEEARAKRLARLFNQDMSDTDSQNSDEEAFIVNLDRAAVNTKIENIMDKVNVHLQVEMNILKKWKDKDLVNNLSAIDVNKPQGLRVIEL